MSFSSYDVGGPASGGGSVAAVADKNRFTRTLFQVRQAGSFHSGQTGRGWDRVAVRCECARRTRSGLRQFWVCMDLI